MFIGQQHLEEGMLGFLQLFEISPGRILRRLDQQNAIRGKSLSAVFQRPQWILKMLQDVKHADNVERTGREALPLDRTGSDINAERFSGKFDDPGAQLQSSHSKASQLC